MPQYFVIKSLYVTLYVTFTGQIIRAVFCIFLQDLQSPFILVIYNAYMTFTTLVYFSIIAIESSFQQIASIWD